MKVPLLDLKPQLKQLEAELKAAACDVIDSTQYILGERVAALEAAMAEWTGAKRAIGVTSGTDALLVALMALEVGRDDIVLMPDYSFFATAGVVARLGARPVFIDIDPLTYNISPDLVREWFAKNPNDAKKVKAIMPVHLYGQCADMEALTAIAAERGIPIVEDAAQAIGASCKIGGVPHQAGTMGAMGCYSFFPSKNLGCLGDGGMVVTDDAKIAELLMQLRNHGMNPKYYHSRIGGNFRIDAMQAAFLLVKLPHLSGWHHMRDANAEYYDTHLEGLPIVTPHRAGGWREHVYNQYVIRVPERRDAFREFLTKREIGTEIYYPLGFHQQECFRDLGYKAGDFPETEAAALETVALPIYSELTREMQDWVVESIKAFFK